VRESYFTVERSDMVIDLIATDILQKQYLGLYITKLPTKGKLYQRLANGLKGVQITSVFNAYSARDIIQQYPTKVLNVSSFWGGSDNWSPLQALGPQNCYVYGDCTLSWCPLTAAGDGGLQSGSNGKGLSFKNDPDALFALHGYTEYLEVEYPTDVYVSEMLIGENRGMGAVKNILAKDFLGNWMTLYSAVVDKSAQSLYDKFSQYRLFRPALCGTLFKTRTLRFEMDTRTVPDWNEWDFFRMGGDTFEETSAVTWNGLGTWQVIYEPDPLSSGMDTFTYAANDCPTNVQNWSPNPGAVHINIVPAVYAGTVAVSRYNGTVINLYEFSLSTANVTDLLEFTLETLPASGVLIIGNDAVTKVPAVIVKGAVLQYMADTTCLSSQASFEYSSSDTNHTGSANVVIQVSCPRACAIEDLDHTVSDCRDGSRAVFYMWNQTHIDNDVCVPTKSYQLPAPYNGIDCGTVPLNSYSAVVVGFFTAFVGCLAIFFLSWLVIYRNTRKSITLNLTINLAPISNLKLSLNS
jgi:hypothetical protein